MGECVCVLVYDQTMQTIFEAFFTKLSIFFRDTFYSYADALQHSMVMLILYSILIKLTFCIEH